MEHGEHGPATGPPDSPHPAARQPPPIPPGPAARIVLRDFAIIAAVAFVATLVPALLWWTVHDTFDRVTQTGTSTDAVVLEPSAEPPVRVEGIVVALPSDRIRQETIYDSRGFPLSVPDLGELRRLLRAGKTAELEAILADFQADAERDFRLEVWATDAFDAMELKDPGLRGVFDAWVAEAPDSAIALIARANYFRTRGHDARGTGWARDVTDAQWEQMHEVFALAYADAQAGLERNPRIVEGYEELMSLANVGGSAYGAEREHYEAGLRVSPNSFWLRSSYMWTLLPRWGGSYEAMRELAEEAQAVADVNPRVRTLFGRIALEQARVATDDYQRQIELITTSLSYGEDSGFYYARGWAYQKLGRLEEALADYTRAVEINPLARRSRRRRDVLRAKLGGAPAAQSAPAD